MSATPLRRPDEAVQVHLVRIADAMTGMRLAEPAFAPRTGAPLLQAGTTLSHRHLHLLRQAGVQSIRVHGDGAALEAPLPASRDAAPVVAAPAVAADAARMLARFVRACGPSVPAQRWACSGGVGRRSAEFIDEAIERLLTIPAARALLMERGVDPGFLAPAMDGAVLSTIAGTALDWDPDRLVVLAMAAFLADIGMVLVPKAILTKPGVLDPAEKAELERHAAVGAELLRPLSGPLSPTIARVAREHHERIDGTGYPARLAGAAICPEAQLVSLAHLYLAAIRGRSYRPALPPLDAMELVASVAGRAVRTDLVEAFTDAVALYPVGSLVRLRTGQCARVLAAGKPRCTQLVVEWASDGRRIAPFEVVAGSRPDLEVVACAA